MPYIKPDLREALLETLYPETPGELNYLITLICKRYWDRIGNYQTINDIVGALECAKLEFYRRVASPYENIAIKRNGDVYDHE